MSTKETLESIAEQLLSLGLQENPEVALGCLDPQANIVLAECGAELTKNIYDDGATVIESRHLNIQGITFRSQQQSRPTTDEEKAVYLKNLNIDVEIRKLTDRIKELEKSRAEA